MDVIQKTIRQIKALKIQGATAVARACLLSLKKDVAAGGSGNLVSLRGKIELLSLARPTEPMARNCLAYLLWKTEKLGSLGNLGTLEEIIDNFLRKIKENEERIIENGKSLVKIGDHVLTHCHSETVVSLLKAAHKKVDFEVFLTETRPLFQGRKTAKELISVGIKTTMVVDSAAPYLISKEDEVPINLVILGVDAIFPNGSCLNKVGSYAIGLAADEAGVPLYLAATILKMTNRPLEVEKRGAKEIWEDKPKNLRILNLAFDFIPAEFINGFITEFGILEPKDIIRAAKKYYPFIFYESV